MFLNIPQFPNFKPLDLNDQADINTLIKQHPPYSDYNFISMWTWDVDQSIQISQLYNNLVVIFSDYITSDNFLSFLGTNNIADTVDVLLTYSNNNDFGKSFLKKIIINY